MFFFYASLTPKIRILFVVLMPVVPAFAASAETVQEPVEEVRPMVGTSGHGHTFPGATLPFGFLQLSPDTRTGGWDGCSGYHYSDSAILGFSHTHLSGT
ncbi:MAG TPA: hypothetical protein VKC60_17775, partial [Opitutaceae bacterium]|nr:hypothetical protein [Opitutaceae bacterium]